MKRMRKLAICLTTIMYMGSAIGSTVYASENDEEAAACEVLQSQEEYVVAFTEEHAPFTYIDSDGNIEGMAIDLMDYIAQNAGIDVTYISLNEVTDASEIDINLSILADDQVDGVSIKSDAYFSLQMMIMGLDNTIVFDGSNIGHLNYSAITNAMVEDELEGCTAYTYASYDELIDALESEEIDYILTTSLVAKQTSALGELLDTNMVQTDFSLDLMLKFNDEMSTEMIEAFNIIIEGLDTEDKYTIMLSAAIESAADQVTLADFIAEHDFEILFGIALIVLAMGSLILHLNIVRRKALTRILTVDKLTGLMTEYRFIQYVENALHKSKKEDEYYLISFDIDNFKYINESYGYEKGTEVIKIFAENLKQTFDKAECIGRTHADEFLIFTKIAPRGGNICGKETCVKCIDNATRQVLGNDYKLMTSAGLYKIEDKSLSMAYMIDCANIARRRGKGTYARTEYMFTDMLEEEIKETNNITVYMEKALLEKEFKMHYQPKIDFETKQIIGAEALVRWYKVDGTQVYPDQFIGLFEKNGFISRLDYYVLDEVCKFITKHPEMPRISINISGYTFQEENLVEKIMEIVTGNGISTSCIEIEVTESAIVTEFELISNKIAELQEMGFTVSMDDFGAGLSSLNRLKDISIDVLKIDKEFLGNGMLNKKGIMILDSIIDMSKKIEITTVAEGVETSSQVELLADLHCNVAQGYYYSKPLPEDVFLNYMVENKNHDSDN